MSGNWTSYQKKQHSPAETGTQGTATQQVRPDVSKKISHQLKASNKFTIFSLFSAYASQTQQKTTAECFRNF